MELFFERWWDLSPGQVGNYSLRVSKMLAGQPKFRPWRMIWKGLSGPSGTAGVRPETSLVKNLKILLKVGNMVGNEKTTKQKRPPTNR
jgi:hypothetical protein